MGDYQPGAKYVLPRDESEFTRLNTQHYFLKKVVYDGRLIFDESYTPTAGNAILDSGTGSGAWIIDLASEVSETVELHGIDVSDANFPKTRPPNVHFRIASATRLPADWTGRFDLVNQRMLMGALLEKEWPIALREFLRVLKPGGRVQLAEMDMPRIINAGPAFKRFPIINRKLYAIRGLFYEVAQQLPRLLQEAGFVEITSELKYGPMGGSWGKMGELGLTSTGGAIKRIVPTFAEAGLIKEEEVGPWYEEMEKEWNEIDGTQYAYRMICARKPE